MWLPFVIWRTMTITKLTKHRRRAEIYLYGLRHYAKLFAMTLGQMEEFTEQELLDHLKNYREAVQFGEKLVSKAKIRAILPSPPVVSLPPSPSPPRPTVPKKRKSPPYCKECYRWHKKSQACDIVPPHEEEE